MSNFSKLVAARVAKTGESWSTAVRHVRAQAKERPQPLPPTGSTGAGTFLFGDEHPKDEAGLFVSNGEPGSDGAFASGEDDSADSGTWSFAAGVAPRA
jgi:hypothetical protein